MPASMYSVNSRYVSMQLRLSACRNARGPTASFGEVRSVEADFCYASSPEEEAKLFQNHMAGGSLLDVGVYGLHFASLFWGSEPQAVLAAADVREGVDCHTNILMKYQNGAIAKISSAISLYKPEVAYVYGTKGYMYLPQFYGAQEIILHIEEEEQHILKPRIRLLKLRDAIRQEIGVKYPFE